MGVSHCRFAIRPFHTLNIGERELEKSAREPNVIRVLNSLGFFLHLYARNEVDKLRPSFFCAPRVLTTFFPPRIVTLLIP